MGIMSITLSFFIFNWDNDAINTRFKIVNKMV